MLQEIVRKIHSLPTEDMSDLPDRLDPLPELLEFLPISKEWQLSKIAVKCWRSSLQNYQTPLGKNLQKGEIKMMINGKPKLKLIAIALLLLSPLGINSTAFAQEEMDRLDIEEIVVTGTKRKVSQQDLGMAVTAITSKQLENTFQHDITALSEFAPNVNLTPQNGFNAIAGGMRGTGFISILVTKDPSVGVSVDEFAFNHVQSQFVELFDIEQIELFRGPQGTLFGKNTTGGAIAITTKKPVLGEFFGEIEGNFSQFSSNDSDATKLKLAVNVPLGENVAARLAVIKDESDGYYSNDKPMGGTFSAFPCAGDAACNAGLISRFPTTGDGSDIGGKDVLAAKLKLRWQPNDWYLADFTYEYVDDQGDTVAAANETPNANQNGGEAYLWPLIGFPGINGGDPFSTGQTYTANAAIDIPGGHEIEAHGFYLNQTFSFDNWQLKSITGMRDQDEVLASTYTGEAYTSLYDASRNSEREQFQQEFRLASQFDGPLNFVAGAAYFQDDVEFVVFGSLGFFIPLAGATFYNDAFEIQYTNQDRESWAIYLDGSYEVTENIKLTLGYRHTKDEKDFKRLNLGGGLTNGVVNPVSNFITIDQFQGPHTNPLPDEAFGNRINNDKTFDADTYRVTLDYTMSNDVMLYLSYATGFVAGGYAETCGSIVSCGAYDSEENKNFEIGIKSDLLDGQLRLNAAIFNTKYDNLQRDTVVTIEDAAGNTFQETISANEGDTTATGLEFEMTWVPTSNFRIDAHLGYLDHEYDSYEPIPGSDYSNLSTPYSPEWNWGISATYFQVMSNGSSLTYNLGIHYQDEFELNPFPANGAELAAGNFVQKANTQAEDRTLLNASVTWESTSEQFEVSIYGRNLTDEEYRVSANPVATLWNFTRHGPPRELGFQLGYSF